MAAKSVTQDMTQGKPVSLLLKFFFPLLFGMLFQQFYNVVDMAIVGKTLGSENLAAVGATGSVNFLILGFCMGVCNGFAIPVAQKFGAKDYKGMRRLVTNSVWLSIVFAVVMTVAVCLLCRDIMVWMRTPADIIDRAYSYILVIFLGIPVTYLYNLLSGIMRAMGDSKNPLIFLVISSVLNIAFDFIAILVFHLGVTGAALATVLSQLISGLCCLWFMKKRYELLKMEPGDWKLRGSLIGRLCGMGIPMGLQYSITAIGSVILQAAVNDLGSVAVAAISTGNRISMFFCCPYDAMGSTMATYAGQNLGAGKTDRVVKGYHAAVRMVIFCAVILCISMECFHHPLIALFLGADGATEAFLTGEGYLTFMGWFFCMIGFKMSVDGLLRGSGDMVMFTVANLVNLSIRVIVAMTCAPRFGIAMVWCAVPIGWTANFLISYARYRTWKWKECGMV